MKRLSRLLAAASFTAVCAMAVPASAATLTYNYTPVTTTGSSFSFSIDSNPTPIKPSDGGFTSTITDYMKDGVADANVTTAFFYSAINGGGINVDFFAPYGAQLYSGSSSAPTLLTGDFALFGDNAQTDLLGTLSVSSAVPEPASWAMMMLGLGSVGFAMRRRQKVATRVSFA